MCVHIHASVCVCAHTCLCVCVCVCAHTCLCVCVCVHTYMDLSGFLCDCFIWSNASNVAHNISSPLTSGQSPAFSGRSGKQLKRHHSSQRGMLIDEWARVVKSLNVSSSVNQASRLIDGSELCWQSSGSQGKVRHTEALRGTRPLHGHREEGSSQGGRAVIFLILTVIHYTS